MNVVSGHMSHRNPAIKLAGSAANPIDVWKAPSAVPVSFLEVKSEAYALCTPSTNA